MDAPKLVAADVMALALKVNAADTRSARVDALLDLLAFVSEALRVGKRIADPKAVAKAIEGALDDVEAKLLPLR